MPTDMAAVEAGLDRIEATLDRVTVKMGTLSEMVELLGGFQTVVADSLQAHLAAGHE